MSIICETSGLGSIPTEEMTRFQMKVFFLTDDVVSVRPPLDGLSGHGRGSFVSLEADFPATGHHLASVLVSTGNVGVGVGVDTVVLLLPMPFRPGFEVLVPFPGLEMFR